MNSFWRKLMEKKLAEPPAATPALSADFAKSLLAGLQENLVADQQQEARKKIPRAFAVLSPVVPLPPASQAGWFGGVPRLPKGVNWPTIDGEPGRFVCQIDLTALPQNMWNGAGPREGWLAVFMHPQKLKPAVLHFTGGLFQRHEGPPQGDGFWFRPFDPTGQTWHQRSPEWPIDITSRVGPLPETAKYRKGFAPGFPDPRKDEVFDVSNPAQIPFNGPTFELLLASIESELLKTSNQISVLTAKELTSHDREKITHAVTVVRETFAEIGAIRRLLLDQVFLFEGQSVIDLLQRLVALRAPAIKRLDDDKAGKMVIDVQVHALAIPRALGQPCWQRDYLGRLYRYGYHSYLRDPSSLPVAQKTRLEAILAFEAAYEHGAMGHAPTGHLHTPYGPGTPTEVLLELPTSDLIGWCWGDMYKVAFFINRDRLEMGRFDGVTAEITN